MRKTILSLSLILAASVGFTHAQDVLKKHGFKKKPLTFCDGQYNEFFNNPEVVQIGSVMINTRTNKVVKLLDDNTPKTTYKAEFSSMCIDPKAEKYYSISPYVYVNNNPIINIDPDGEDWYQAENGNAVWRRSSDATYTDDKGVDYKNIGQQYITASGSQITLFQQKTNDEGEMYLTSTTFDTKGKISTDKVLGVLALQNSDASREASMKSWANPTIGNYIKAIFTEVLSQYKNPYLVVGGLSMGVAGLSALGESSLSYAPRVRARGVEDPVSHNFPYSYDKTIVSQKPAIVTGSGYKIYRLEGSMNGKSGVYEIGMTGSGVIDHRFFRPTN